MSNANDAAEVVDVVAPSVALFPFAPYALELALLLCTARTLGLKQGINGGPLLSG